ncbi:uncharacterized protein [Blastocystis hominis]|uniref:Uncharacterized protein n=1 Tax=Blastocystis hominis TaxID=12968 RepID=D8LW09_BLAHO|nr:uncharacterized protein [Blastocystis hominis]CBK19998.2 unnamed protein product [Blastocystis hominis]|eukprot:XP_012894046.1 uncharacterized protein [Blastocystis hominis]
MNASAIITYHPIIFHGIKKLTPDDRVARIVMGCIKNDIAVYSPHTACDASKGGVNDWIVDGLGEIASSAPITPDRENPEFGIGRIATLASPYPTISQLIERMKVHFAIPHLQLATNLPLDSPVRKVAVCAGSGDSVLAVIEADFYVSGELSHHVILDAVSHDRSVMVCNHSNTERGFLKELRARLESELGEEFTFVVSQTDRDPLSVFCFVCSTPVIRLIVYLFVDVSS